MNLLIYCAGGFGREVIDVARRLNERDRRWNEIGFLDDTRREREYYGARVFKFDEAHGSFAFETAIASGEPTVRRLLRRKLEAAGVSLASVIDPSAVVSSTAVMRPGCIVFPGCYISSLARLSANVALIGGSMVGHDTTVGEDTVISGHVNIGGAGSIGDCTFVGMGSQVKEGTAIGRSTIIGMGSIVYTDIPEGVIAMGNPCRSMQKNVDGKVFHRTP